MQAELSRRNETFENSFEAQKKDLEARVEEACALFPGVIASEGCLRHFQNYAMTFFKHIKFVTDYDIC